METRQRLAASTKDVVVIEYDTKLRLYLRCRDVCLTLQKASIAGQLISMSGWINLQQQLLNRGCPRLRRANKNILFLGRNNHALVAAVSPKYSRFVI